MNPNRDQIRSLIENGQIKNALENMKPCWPMATQLLSQINMNETAKMMGTISFEEFFRINNQVTFSALSMLSTPTSCDENVQVESFQNPDSMPVSTQIPPVTMPKREKVKVFLSYAHKDEPLKDELDAHLAILRRAEKIDVWQDRQIEIGDEWDDEIREQMAAADVILLLVSANFIASKYIWEKEVALAMERHAAKSAVVVPIIIKPCEWKDAPFSKLQALPRDGKPVSTFQPSPDQAMAEIAGAIRRLVEKMTA